MIRLLATLAFLIVVAGCGGSKVDEPLSNEAQKQGEAWKKQMDKGAKKLNMNDKR